jgi:hypothetical protein
MLFFIRREEPGAVMGRTHKCAAKGAVRVLALHDAAATESMIHASQACVGAFCSINISLW